MNNLFKLKKSDDPLLTDDEYVYVKDATVTIQICGKGLYCVNKWEILSADEMLWSEEVQMPYQSYWLRRFIEIWNRVEDIESQRYWKRKQKIVN